MKHFVGDSCKPPHETPGEAASPDPALERRRQQPDMVNHPPHYMSYASGVECIVVAEWMSFCLGNALKYIWRCHEKGDPVENLEKARWYIDREIARLKGTSDEH
jgi:hypothetical protein